jgi:hypothetical protein
MVAREIKRSSHFVGSRRVFVSPCTLKPTNACIRQQAEAFVGHTQAEFVAESVGSRANDQADEFQTSYAVSASA